MTSPLTIHDLLKDPLYKAWFQKIPIERSVGTKPWRVWVKLENGRWAKTKQDFAKYSEAFNWIVRNLKKYPDLVLYSKGHEFKPPIVRKNGHKMYWPIPLGYDWCGYCRRPTIFGKFTKHHAIPIYPNGEEQFRCSICGARKNFLKNYYKR